MTVNLLTERFEMSVYYYCYWSVSVPVTLSDLERRDARGQIFQAVLRNNARTVWPRKTKFGMITCVGRTYFRGVSHAPTARGQCSSILNFWGSFYLWLGPKATQFCGFLSMRNQLSRNYQNWRDNTYGEGACFQGSASPQPKDAGVPALPKFGGSLLFMRTPFVADLPNWTW